METFQRSSRCAYVCGRMIALSVIRGANRSRERIARPDRCDCGRLSNQGARVEVVFVARHDYEPGDDGPVHRYHASIQKQIDDLGIRSKVHLMGYIQHLSGFLKKMDAVVVPSLCHEAQPMVLMESMAAGTPVVASRVGGVPEVLTSTLARWIFCPGDVDDLCSKLTDVLELTSPRRFNWRIHCVNGPLQTTRFKNAINDFRT